MYDDIFEDEIIGIEIILNYLSRLKDMKEEERFEEIGREKIVESIDHFVSESDNDLCSLIDKLILDLADPELCYEMAANIYWVDTKKYGQAVIDSKDIENNYFFAANIGDADVLSHGRVIIDSKDLYYNYTFAEEIDGCDIKGHCDVLLNSSEREKYINKAQEETQYHLYPYLGIEKGKVKEKNRKN